MRPGLAGSIERVVAGAVRQALRDSRTSAIMIMAPGSPEGAWLAELCGRYGLAACRAPEASAPLVAALGGDAAGHEVAGRAAAEVVAVRENMLLAHPANRTALLLAGPPRQPLLPLGDVPGSVVEALRGAWSAPAEVLELAAAAGGVAILDACLYRWLERREAPDAAMAELPESVARDLRHRIGSGCFHRRRAGLVVKLGHRTIGHDLQI